jgi:hypothetical protein
MFPARKYVHILASATVKAFVAGPDCTMGKLKIDGWAIVGIRVA